jgi:hypothetical protein
MYTRFWLEDVENDNTLIPVSILSIPHTCPLFFIENFNLNLSLGNYNCRLHFIILHVNFSKFSGRLSDLLVVDKVPINCTFLESEEQYLWHGKFGIQNIEIQLW